MVSPTNVSVLGLGEAGSIVASDLAQVASVTGFDPLLVGTRKGYSTVDSAAECVSNADVIIALTAAPDAIALFESVFDAIPVGAVYADFSSSSPALKIDLAQRAATRNILFVDAVLMSPVPQKRIATPVQASGSGALALTEMLGPLGMHIEVVGELAGEAAARKLLRSIVVKGLTALLVESLRTADALELTEWFSGHIAETLTTMTPAILTRLIDGTAGHSVRRIHEMSAAVEMVESAGVAAHMTRATVKVLESAADEIPRGSAF